MKYSTSPSPYPHPSNRRTTPPSAGAGSPLRVIGLLLALASIILALLAVSFSLHTPGVLLLALLILLIAARIFALWLGSHSSHTADPHASQVHAIDQRGAGISHALLTPRLTPTPARPGGYQPGEAAFVLPMPVTDPGNQYRVSNNYGLPPAAPPFYEPIENDEFFSLDQPITNERCFLLPKEGEPLVECQDRYALAASNGYRCYAVADGVAGSFVPGPWARLVAKSFVQRAALFTGKDDFQHWLAACSQQWHAWIEQRWVPTINALRARNGNGIQDWSQEIRQGAQTTLIACLLDPPRQNEGRVNTAITVFAIGDSEFFHFTPDGNGGWLIRNRFPYEKSEDFDSYPATLVTAARPELVGHAWMRRRNTILNASPGDLVVLTTDTLAKWMLAQIEHKVNRWQALLAITTAGEFEQYIRREFRRDGVEDDDVTMLIVPV